MFTDVCRLTLSVFSVGLPVMQKSFFRLFIAANLLASFSSSSLYAQDIDVQSNDGLLSIQANNTTATQLADVLSEELGIVVVVTGDAETRVNIDIVEETIEKAVSQLSPNNMLFRSGEGAESDIVEIVLMMGESGGNSISNGGGSDQFLPSGSPAEDVVVEGVDPNRQSIEGAALRDPNRAQLVQDNANGSLNKSGLNTDSTGNSAFDPVSGLPIDPQTGLPLQQQ